MAGTYTLKTSSTHIEHAAGGLVWSDKHGGPGWRVAIVFRTKHKDWTLPKGRPDDDETLEATAQREAMEETGVDVSRDEFLGCYCYRKEGQPKFVLMWRMTDTGERYTEPAKKKEIGRVRWLPPEEAICKLSYPAERQFLARHCGQMRGVSAGLATKPSPKINRLRAALQSCQERFLASTAALPADAADTWWVPCAQHSLDATRAAIQRRDPDGGWSALHDAQRFMVFGMNDHELMTQATSLQVEVKRKLKGWRLTAVDELFKPLDLTKWRKANRPLQADDRALLRQTLVESLGVLNEHSDNLYHRMRLVGRQLTFLVTVCAGLIIAALAVSHFFAPSGSKLSSGHLVAVALAGALGGVVSAMYQLSRVGEAKIPEALLEGLVTSGRPLVGAASALFVYAVMQSNLISLIDASKVSLEAGLVLGFVAGFSEQYVLATVARVTGGGNTETEEGGARKGGRKGNGNGNSNDNNDSAGEHTASAEAAVEAETPQAHETEQVAESAEVPAGESGTDAQEDSSAPLTEATPAREPEDHSPDDDPTVAT